MKKSFIFLLTFFSPSALARVTSCRDCAPMSFEVFLILSFIVVGVLLMAYIPIIHICYQERKKIKEEQSKKKQETIKRTTVFFMFPQDEKLLDEKDEQNKR